MLVYLFKPTEPTTPRVNHNVNCGLWVITLCQRRFTNCCKCSSLVGCWQGEAGRVQKQEACGKSLCPLLNLLWTFNCSRKRKSWSKKKKKITGKELRAQFKRTSYTFFEDILLLELVKYSYRKCVTVAFLAQKEMDNSGEVACHCFLMSYKCQDAQRFLSASILMLWQDTHQFTGILCILKVHWWESFPKRGVSSELRGLLILALRMFKNDLTLSPIPSSLTLWILQNMPLAFHKSVERTGSPYVKKLRDLSAKIFQVNEASKHQKKFNYKNIRKIYRGLCLQPWRRKVFLSQTPQKNHTKKHYVSCLWCRSI